MAAEPLPRRFTVAEYYRMSKVGILAPDERTELIEGEIIRMPSINAPHARCVGRLTTTFVIGTHGVALVWVQNPVHLDDGSEPVPDLMLLRPRVDFYAQHPTPPDVLLLVEVSDTTLRYDQGTKVPLYARHWVPEVWVVDLNGQAIHVYREPALGGYRVTFVRRRGERIGPAAIPDWQIAVDDILG